MEPEWQGQEFGEENRSQNTVTKISYYGPVQLWLENLGLSFKRQLWSRGWLQHQASTEYRPRGTESAALMLQDLSEKDTT